MKQRIWMEVEGVPVVGDLFLPGGTGPFPAVVVAGPMTSVKEQVTGVYACALAVRGIAALCIDHRHYGESGGGPRQFEFPADKITDLRTAVTWLAGHPFIDAARLGMVGVCLGAGYAAHALSELGSVKAFGTIAGYFPDPGEMRATNPGYLPEVESGRNARIEFETTGVAAMVPAAAVGHGAPMSHHDIVEYYGTGRAGVPNYRNEFAVMSREPWLLFDAQAAAASVRVPTFGVHSEQALAPVWARRFYDAITVDAELAWLDAQSQADFYDNPRLVNAAAELVAQHLLRHL